jgi:hypothetical protein
MGGGDTTTNTTNNIQNYTLTDLQNYNNICNNASLASQINAQMEQAFSLISKTLAKNEASIDVQAQIENNLLQEINMEGATIVDSTVNIKQLINFKAQQTLAVLSQIVSSSAVDNTTKAIAAEMLDIGQTMGSTAESMTQMGSDIASTNSSASDSNQAVATDRKSDFFPPSGNTNTNTTNNINNSNVAKVYNTNNTINNTKVDLGLSYVSRLDMSNRNENEYLNSLGTRLMTTMKSSLTQSVNLSFASIVGSVINLSQESIVDIVQDVDLKNFMSSVFSAASNSLMSSDKTVTSDMIATNDNGNGLGVLAAAANQLEASTTSAQEGTFKEDSSGISHAGEAVSQVIDSAGEAVAKNNPFNSITMIIGLVIGLVILIIFLNMYFKSKDNEPKIKERYRNRNLYCPYCYRLRR